MLINWVTPEKLVDKGQQCIFMEIIWTCHPISPDAIADKANDLKNLNSQEKDWLYIWDLILTNNYILLF